MLSGTVTNYVLVTQLNTNFRGYVGEFAEISDDKMAATCRFRQVAQEFGADNSSGVRPPPLS